MRGRATGGGSPIARPAQLMAYFTFVLHSFVGFGMDVLAGRE